MRVGLLDVGSTSAHLQVVELRQGGDPRPMYRQKVPVRLARAVGLDGTISKAGVRWLADAVTAAMTAAQRHQVDEFLPYATAVIRDAPNRAEICREIYHSAGVRLGFLSGEDDACLTFLAVHRWFGWQAGPLLLVDIGGGSVEIACGRDEAPCVAASLPISVRQLTKSHLPSQPASADEVLRLRAHVVETLSQCLEDVGWAEVADLKPYAVGASKTLRQLALLAADGARRDALRLSRADLRRWIPRLAKRTTKSRAKLPGVSKRRAPYVLAGAIVAEAVMATLGIKSLALSPWGLREGILLNRIEPAPDPSAWMSTELSRSGPVPPQPYSVIQLADRRG
jgi:exopolyphosphatase/guanosine-5'-triphosphate,3'-diphosphate pyrophosphatase